MEKIWQVIHEVSKCFGTEKEARDFYKKTLKKQNLITIRIKHRVEDNARMLVTVVTSLLLKHPKFRKVWEKLPAKQQKEIVKKQQAEVRDLVEAMLCQK
jgi:hypothetical protein